MTTLGKHWKLSEETKRKMSESAKRKVFTTEEHRKNMGLSHKGSKRTIETKKKMSLNHRRFQTEETRKKISEGHKGEKSRFWKGGVSTLNQRIRQGIEYSLWREAVFARDNWTCQKIGIKGGKLCAHHIQNFSDYPELRFAIDNGITLSEKVHREFHKKYGTKNNTKEQIKEFLI